VVAVEREAARKWGWARPPRLNTETLFTVWKLPAFLSPSRTTVGAQCWFHSSPSTHNILNIYCVNKFLGDTGVFNYFAKGSCSFQKSGRSGRRLETHATSSHLKRLDRATLVFSDTTMPAERPPKPRPFWRWRHTQPWELWSPSNPPAIRGSSESLLNSKDGLHLAPGFFWGTASSCHEDAASEGNMKRSGYLELGCQTHLSYRLVPIPHFRWKDRTAQPLTDSVHRTGATAQNTSGFWTTIPRNLRGSFGHSEEVLQA
jgi:hypothetical protein